ncbi:hypothetical protein BDV19DRAFT_260295 [Aspergillus venezuelensis]
MFLLTIYLAGILKARCQMSSHWVGLWQKGVLETRVGVVPYLYAILCTYVPLDTSCGGRFHPALAPQNAGMAECGGPLDASEMKFSSPLLFAFWRLQGLCSVAVLLA